MTQFFLHVAAVFDKDFAPVASDNSASGYVHVAADYDIADHRSVRMNKGAFVNNRAKAFKFKDISHSWLWVMRCVR